MKNSENDLIKGVNSGSRVCLSKLISLVESDKSPSLDLISKPVVYNGGDLNTFNGKSISEFRIYIFNGNNQSMAVD